MFKVSYHNLTSCTKVVKTLEDVFEKIVDSQNFRDVFNNVIDNEIVSICGISYYKSFLLANADPIAYKCYLEDYADAIRDEVIETIKTDLAEKEFSEFYGFTITEI